MAERILAALLLCTLAACSGGSGAAGDAANDYETMPGFLPLHWDEGQGRLLVQIEQFDEPFIYQSSLPRGVGSNDIGLDRGRIVDQVILEALL